MHAVGCVVLAVLVEASLVGDNAAPDRPNILFCFADDWGRYASAYASLAERPSPNDVVKTPHIDRIAREGVLFRNAFVNAPSCTPCRSSLLSGRYFFNTGRGAVLRGAVWDSSIPSFPLLLRDAGYHIGETWKVWSPGTPVDAPFGSGQYAYEKAGGSYNNFSENAARMVREGSTFDDAKSRLLSEVRRNFDMFLQDRAPGQPFLYWFGPTLVHRAWQKGSGRELWGIDPDRLSGKLPRFLPDVPEVRADFADYLGEIQAFDAGVGVLLQKLEEIGELERTLVVVSGDHGAPGFPRGKCNLYDFGVGVALMARGPGGTRGRVVDDLVNLMDLAPTFLDVAGVAAPPKIDGRSFLNLIRSGRSGQIDSTRTWVVTGRERHVDTARAGNLPYPHRALRTREFLYIRNFKPDRWPMGDPAVGETPSKASIEANTFATFADMDASPTKAWLIANAVDPNWKRYFDYAFGKRPAEELYDLSRDPDQIENRAEDPAYAARKAELSVRLTQILTDAGDPRVTGTGDSFERPPFTDRQPAAESPKNKRQAGRAAHAKPGK